MDPRIKAMFMDEYAEEGAARFGVGPEELTFIGGFQNFIYSYQREDGKYILRFTPSTLRTWEGVSAELDWILYLAQHELKVSVPLLSMEGKRIERIAGGGIASFYATSFTYAPGRKIGYPECLGNPYLYEQCGRFTSRLHDLSRSFKPTEAGRRHTWERNEYLLRAERYLPQGHQPILLALNELKSELAGLPVTPEHFGLIHGDINVGNFTLDESGEMTLFDFDECQYSWYTEDIAIQLYYLLYVFGEDSRAERKTQYELFMKHFERGYTDGGRQLPRHLKDQLGIFLRLRDIIVLVGMHRSWDLSQPDDWTRDFLQDSWARITNGKSLIDGF
ncbi:Ser/Thr protein kinase RdoA (MazF antagonist) [Paenibacillus sp. BK033]|uniref:phosphotransferase enzyme family protein n=1 Tax=Paenibacillus sp. BK033 TaxID=2512133 RepID=UPI00104B2B87|nr:phosphotransferase [Paenibacillus sp. BK033]TCM96427.1 Ser/Thr protein kinase RdoA (MazF antagonist) [Paenibacillus sp. BK033]